MKKLFNNVKEFISDCQSSLPQEMSSDLFLPGQSCFSQYHVGYDILADVLQVSHCHAIFAQVQ